MLWSALLSFVTSGGLRAIFREITDLQRDRLNATNEAEQQRLEHRIQFLKIQAANIQDARKYLSTRIIQALFAGPYIIYFWKVLVWDKVFGLGVTVDLSDNQWYSFLVILGGYFVLEYRASRIGK